MSDICEVICFGYGVGFAVTAVLAVYYIFEKRDDGCKGFAEYGSLTLWSGALICAALWPLIVSVLAVDAVRMSLAKKESAT